MRGTWNRYNEASEREPVATPAAPFPQLISRGLASISQTCRVAQLSMPQLPSSVLEWQCREWTSNCVAKQQETVDWMRTCTSSRLNNTISVSPLCCFISQIHTDKSPQHIYCSVSHIVLDSIYSFHCWLNQSCRTARFPPTPVRRWYTGICHDSATPSAVADFQMLLYACVDDIAA